MDYQAALDYLLAKLPMFQRVGQQAVKKDLTNTRAFLEYLNNPEQSFNAIHVAGTNGKGSVSHMLCAIAMKAGFKTGLYTSPHLLDFRERIRINGAMIPKEAVVNFVEANQETIETIEPSFFEATVAMAFDHFARQEVDLAIIETGLGGRLDSTNVLEPQISVITNVGLDHQAMLGPDLPTIAREKAGIIKPDTPLIVGESQPESRPVLEEVASDQNAPITFADENWAFHVHHFVRCLNLMAHHLRDDLPLNISCDLTGYYQARNIATSLETLYQINSRKAPWFFPTDTWQKGLAEVKASTGLRGRWEVLHHQPLTICDIAHNPDAVRWHREQINHYYYQNLHIIFGMTQEKDLAPILREMPAFAHYYFCAPDLPRGKPSQKLQNEAQQYGIKGEAIGSVKAALEKVWEEVTDQDLVLITGSAFVVAEVLEVSRAFSP